MTFIKIIYTCLQCLFACFSPTVTGVDTPLSNGATPHAFQPSCGRIHQTSELYFSQATSLVLRLAADGFQVLSKPRKKSSTCKYFLSKDYRQSSRFFYEENTYCKTIDDKSAADIRSWEMGGVATQIQSMKQM